MKLQGRASSLVWGIRDKAHEKASFLARYESQPKSFRTVMRQTISRAVGRSIGWGPPLRSRVPIGAQQLVTVEPGHQDSHGTYFQLRSHAGVAVPQIVEVPFPSVSTLGRRYVRFDNARVTPRSSNVVTDTGVIFPELHDVPEWGVPAREWSPWDLHRYDLNGGHIRAFSHDAKLQWNDWSGKKPDLTLDSAISLFEVAEHHYGHWLMDILHRVIAVRSLPPNIPFLIGESVPTNIEYWLSRLSPDRRIVRVNDRLIVRVRELYVPLQCAFLWRNTPYNEDITQVLPAKFDACAFGEIQDLVAESELIPSRSRRIWLRRDRVRPGHLVNEPELARFAYETWGFESVYPEDVHMAELAKILNESEFVISPTGSHLSNLMAAKPGVRVLVLNGTTDYIAMTSGGFPRFFQKMGHASALLLGPTVRPNEDFDYAPFRLSDNDLAYAKEWLEDSPAIPKL